LGFASCATVPAVYLLTGWMPERRSAAIGQFMTTGGLGAVAGGVIGAVITRNNRCYVRLASGRLRRIACP